MTSPDRLKISKEFHINGQGEWLSLEYPLSPEDNVLECFNTAREKLIEAATKRYTLTDFNTGQTGIVKEVNIEAERVEVEIDNATSTEELDKLLDKAILYGLKEHYMKRQKELMQ